MNFLKELGEWLKGENLDNISNEVLKLEGFKNIPLIPIPDFVEFAETVGNLYGRGKQTTQAIDGLNNKYTINGKTATAKEFMFDTSKHENVLEELCKNLDENKFKKAIESLLGNIDQSNEFSEDASSEPLTAMSLDTSKQWAMSWTNYGDIYSRSKKYLEKFSLTLENTDHANREFWPTIARYGLAFNLIILEKIRAGQLLEIQSAFKEIWTDDMTKQANDGLLYFIDMRIFNALDSKKVERFERFTPSTITLLQQDPDTKKLIPVAVKVSKPNMDGFVYTKSSKSWLYALQAVKTSITVFGIWIGHVYKMHIISAAMIEVMKDKIPESHPIQQIISPQSKYVIPFDMFLLLFWSHIAPPTSISSPLQFFKLINKFAENRNYFDDDPNTTLEKFGILEKDFSYKEPWDQYPIVNDFLKVWDATENYVYEFVKDTYADDATVKNDADLQEWITEISNSDGGNINGMPKVTTKKLLVSVLTSLIYRITIHGTGRLLSTTNPGLSFVSNFPPCLQISDIPDPDTEMTTKKLLEYMPKTGTIGGMVTFYFTFSLSEPYEPFIPFEGVESNLFFFNGNKEDPRNKALVEYRRAIGKLIKAYSPISPPKLVQTYQWPMCIET